MDYALQSVSYCNFYSGFQCILPSDVGVSLVPIKLSLSRLESENNAMMHVELFDLLKIKNVSSGFNFYYLKQSMSSGIGKLLAHKSTSYSKLLSLHNCVLSSSK